MESSTALAARPEGGARARGRRRLRPLVVSWMGPALYVVALGCVCAFRGLPTSRDALFLWIVLGLLAASLSDVRRWGRGMLVDWLPFALVLFAYDVLRGYADSFFSAHVWPQLRADELLFGGSVPTVWLQRRLWDGSAGLDWIDYAAWSVYLTHFFATLLVAAALWLRASHLFRRYVGAVSALAVAGFATYALFPAVPPWMASRDGQLAPTERIVSVVSSHAPIDFFGAVWERGAHYANDVAAMPSLHAAYAMLIALFFWPLVGWRWRLPLVAYALGMGFALVYTSEHYVSDVLAGWLYAAAALALVTLVARHRERARA
jgi:membrane-associated phospholipid phosphatase